MVELRVSRLSQEEAGQLMRELSGKPLENFLAAFHEEKKQGSNLIRALAEGERIYFTVSVGGLTYLLVGVNPSTQYSIGLSSLANISGQSLRKAADCLRTLIEEELIPMCRESGKLFIDAKIAGGVKVYKNLMNVPPRNTGVKLTGSSCRFEILQ